MNAREVIADELCRLGSFMPDEETDIILFRLNIRGFTIMSKEDVEAVRAEAIAKYKAAIDSLKNVTDADIERVRDKALEEAAALIETHAYTDGTGGRRLEPSLLVKYDQHHATIASAIRSLKSIPRKE